MLLEAAALQRLIRSMSAPRNAIWNIILWLNVFPFQMAYGEILLLD